MLSLELQHSFLRLVFCSSQFCLCCLCALCDGWEWVWQPTRKTVGRDGCFVPFYWYQYKSRLLLLLRSNTLLGVRYGDRIPTIAGNSLITTLSISVVISVVFRRKCGRIPWNSKEFHGSWKFRSKKQREPTKDGIALIDFVFGSDPTNNERLVEQGRTGSEYHTSFLNKRTHSQVFKDFPLSTPFVLLVYWNIGGTLLAAAARRLEPQPGGIPQGGCLH